MTDKVTYRAARIDDAPFVAMIMAEAIGDNIMERSACGIQPDDQKRIKMLTNVAINEESLYSWRRCILAETSAGNVVGGLISYPGEGYLLLRENTFNMVRDLIDFDVSTMDLEAADGEYYLDSLAVLPGYRNCGIGRALLQKGIEQGLKMGRNAHLACAPDNLIGKHLYQSLGFVETGHFFLFGEDYLRMEFMPNRYI